MFCINGANRGGVGYNDNRAYLANEITGARISVNDSGVPQYQSAFQGTAYNIYHSGNSNKSDVAWGCSTLTANAGIVAYSPYYAGQLTIKRTDYAYDSVIRYENSNGFLGCIGMNSLGYPYWTNDSGGNTIYALYSE